VLDDDYRKLEARIRKIAPLLDQSEPVAFVGMALLSQVCAVPQEFRSQASAFREGVTAGWFEICQHGLSVQRWKQIGNDLQADVNRDEAWWRARTTEFIALEKEVDARNVKLGLHYDKDRGIDIIKNQLMGSFPGVCVPPVTRRALAFLEYLSAKMRQTRKQASNPNDYFDARHLFHLARPAFLATMDLNLIKMVDSTCKMQRPWVRCPVELVSDRIARCAPWGRPGKFVAAVVLARAV
jgi:hypothetical protein